MTFRILIFLSFIAISTFGLKARAADENPINQEEKQMIDALIKKVDAIKLPMEAGILEDYESEGGEGDFLIKMNMEDVQKFEKFRSGVRATLVGHKNNPSAVIFYVKSDLNFYLIPFKGVDKIPEPLKLSKLASRFFRIESNRSGLGVMTTAVGPS